MSGEKITVGVIGAGPWGENHIRNYCSLGYDVLVSEINEERLKELREKYSIKTTTDYNDLLENEKIKGISVCVPAAMHYEITKKALNAGKHVLVEKPMAMNVENAEEMIALAKERGLILMVGHIFRYNPAIDKIKEMMNDNSFGKIYSIYTSRMGLKQPRNDVGATLNYAVHDIDIMCNLMNEKYPEEVTLIKSCNLGNPQEDLSIITIKFKDETLGYCQVGWLTPKKMRDLIITAERKSAEVDTMNQKIQIINDHLEEDSGSYKIVNEESSELNLEKNEPLKEELMDFVNCINNKTTPKASGETGLAVTKILTAALKSGEEKRTINLDENGDIVE